MNSTCCLKPNTLATHLLEHFCMIWMYKPLKKVKWMLPSGVHPTFLKFDRNQKLLFNTFVKPVSTQTLEAKPQMICVASWAGGYLLPTDFPDHLDW